MDFGHHLNARQHFTSTQLLGLCRDIATRHLTNRVKSFANTRSVLVYGETGAGKEVVVRALHEQGDRNRLPLVEVQCGAQANHELTAAYLFGQERGAFTGATETKLGIFEKAHNATVYLDEVALLPLQSQGMLLRTLEGEAIYRLGSTIPIKSDFRLIAATNQNLTNLVQQGKFKHDLLQRLNLAPLMVPPLRNRQEDVWRLANLFADQGGKTLDFATEKLLENRPWPGNIRELRNVIERAVSLAGDSPVIGVKHIEFDTDFAFDDGTAINAKNSLAGGIIALDDPRMIQAMQEIIVAVSPNVTDTMPLTDVVESFLIQATLKITGGNKVAASERLGIGRQTLYNKLRRYKIPDED